MLQIFWCCKRLCLAFQKMVSHSSASIHMVVTRVRGGHSGSWWSFKCACKSTQCSSMGASMETRGSCVLVAIENDDVICCFRAKYCKRFDCTLNCPWNESKNFCHLYHQLFHYGFCLVMLRATDYLTILNQWAVGDGTVMYRTMVTAAWRHWKTVRMWKLDDT